MLKRTLYLGILVFFVSLALQSLIWSQDDMIDIDVWAAEAEYIVTGNPLAFEGGGYGYPAGPIILGIIFVQKISALSYHDSVLVFVTLFDSLAIALCSILAYLIQKKYWWPIATCIVLSLAPMYQHSTPTSACISVLTVLICLFTLYLLQEKSSRTALLWWGVTAGIMLCTRLDVGSVFVSLCGAFLVYKYGWKKLVLPAITGAFVFCIFDLFLWLIPLKHIQDMIIRITFHYFEYPMTLVPHDLVVHFSLLAFVSMFLAAMSLFIKKNPPVPQAFCFALISVTAFLYAVFLTSHSQAMRYFQPMIFVWETLLPLLMFYFISRFEFSFITTPHNKERARVVGYSLVLALLSVRSVVIFYSWWVQ